MDRALTTEQYIIPESNFDHLIIWLDQSMDHRNGITEKLSNAIDITMDAPMNRYEIDQLIQNTEDDSINTDRSITVDNLKQCLTVIGENHQRSIILIISAPFSQELLPTVIMTCPSIERIYVFSPDTSQDVDWALNSTKKVLMFNSSDDLSARILYDVGGYYIQQGRTFSTLGQHCQALRYFYLTKKLWIRANTLFHPSLSFNLQLVMLLITKEEGQLSRHIINDILNDISYR